MTFLKHSHALQALLLSGTLNLQSASLLDLSGAHGVVTVIKLLTNSVCCSTLLGKKLMTSDVPDLLPAF